MTTEFRILFAITYLSVNDKNNLPTREAGTGTQVSPYIPWIWHSPAGPQESGQAQDPTPD